MIRQRGFTMTAIMWVLAVIALLGAIAGAIATFNHWESGIDKRGYERGKKEVGEAYTQRDNAALMKANARINELQNKLRSQEHQFMVDMNKIVADHAKEKADAKRRYDADIVAVRNGTLKLRDRNATTRSATVCGGSATAQAGTARPGDNGEAGAELSAEAAEFLLGLANDADDTARQLGKAQELILLQYRTCSGG